MKSIFVVISVVVSAMSWASDGKDELDIYTFQQEHFRSSAVASSGLSSDAQTTARIKRYMAGLLYPVDLSVLTNPDKDLRFQNEIRLLQKQMGVPSTGVLTVRQYDRLVRAATMHTELPVFPTGFYVDQYETGRNSNVSAKGAWSVDPTDRMASYNPINTGHVDCDKAEKLCTVVTADVLLPYELVAIPVYTLQVHTEIFEVESWRPERITAVQELSCSKTTMTIDIKGKAVKQVTVPRYERESCNANRTVKPSFVTLLDGSKAFEEVFARRRKEVQDLVYTPARMYMPGAY